MTAFRQCPGCGERGDIDHIVACVQFNRDACTVRGWKRGAEFVLGAVRTQVGRRGVVDYDALASAVAAIAPTVGWWL